MTTSPTAATLAPPPSPPHLRHNYWAFAFEGALYMGAMNFISATTILPKMLQSLGGPVWLVCMAPILNLMAFLPAPILCAHYVERLRQYRPFLLRTALIQRLPYFIAAVLLLFAGHIPIVALVALALTPFLSGIVGGIGLTPWQQLFTKSIPRDRRQSLFAIRFAVPGLIGVAAGYTIERVLAAHPGATGYAILYFIAFAVLMLSYFTFAQIREPADHRPPPTAKPPDLVTHLRSVPGEILHDRHFLLLLGVRFFRATMFIIAPLLAIHCQTDILHQPIAFLGRLVIVQMIGAIAGNVAAALLGDRFGPKVILLIGLLVYATMSACSIFATSQAAWLAIFVLFGSGWALSDVGVNSLGLEMGPRDRRATFLATAALVNLPGMLLAWSLAIAFHDHFTYLALATILGCLIAFAFLLPMRERHDTPPPPVAAPR